MLRLDRLINAGVMMEPYPHAVIYEALEDVQELNAEFPAKESFGPTIRMDGDLTSGDQGYEALLSSSTAYARLHQQVYSVEFLKAFLELFRHPIEEAWKKGELLADPFRLNILAQPVEKRISGRGFVGGDAWFLYPRFDIGYGGLGYGVANGGRGIHIDNPPRLISILVFLNEPKGMVGGTHRLYGLDRNRPVLNKTLQPKAALLVASLQSNRAFHDVEPITRIEGERRAFYIAVSCNRAIWKKETHPALNSLSQNRYAPPPPTFAERFAAWCSKFVPGTSLS